MRVLVLADIDSNLAALQAVATDAEAHDGWEAVRCRAAWWAMAPTRMPAASG